MVFDPRVCNQLVQKLPGFPSEVTVSEISGDYLPGLSYIESQEPKIFVKTEGNGDT